MNNTFTFLGTGGSLGIPVIGCDCEVCQSSNPKNKRLRSASLVQIGEKKILIDAGPDFRAQALHHRIRSIDGFIITHAHHDHIAGIDDLRVYFFQSKDPLPCLVSSETLNNLKRSFHYIFGNYESKTIIPKFDVHLLPNSRGALSFMGEIIQYLTFEQAGMSVNGFRFGDLAYLSDIKVYPETIFDDLRGVKTLIISALRYTPSHLHFTVDEAIDFSKRVGTRNTWLTHIAHELDDEKTNAYLPDNIRVAYDGLTIDFSMNS